MRWALVAVALLWVAAANGTALPGPLACSDECVVPSNGAGYVPPVLIVESGASVVWESLDSSHVSAEGVGPGDVADPCFIVSYSSANPSDPVTLTHTGTGIEATVNGNTAACGNTRALADGGFLLPYWCALHPNMRGAFVVQPADRA